jgi:hypothetical protein
MSEFTVFGKFVGKFPLPAESISRGSLAADLSLAREHAFKAAETFEAKRAELEADRRWSEEGRREQLRKLGSEVLESLRKQLESPLAGAATVLADRRSKFGSHVERAKDDLTGQLADQEARAYLRSLAPDERLRVARSSPQLRDAALRADPALSGLHAEAQALLRKDGALALHGDKLAETEALEGALAHVTKLVDVVRTEVSRVAGIAGGK